jgi:serine/threonine-protein kinase
LARSGAAVHSTRVTDGEAPRLLSSSADAAGRVRAQRMVGRVLSKRYRVDEVLALGGMGAVYRGEHMLMHKRIAIKVLHPEIEGLPDLVKRFEREAVAGAHIVHPNVASATDFGQLDDGSYFLVLEFVRGVTLHEIVRRGAMQPARAANVARQLACALEACHATGIYHRDVKPKNVMVTEDQNDLTKLIDFGLARVNVERLSTLTAEEDARRSLEEGRLTGVGLIFGTIAYLAPEAALGMDAVDARSDLYALGLLFYEMLTGKHPFDAIDPVELFRLQRTGRIPPFDERAPDAPVPAELEAIVMRLLEKNPDARYQTGEELVAAIDGALASAGIAPVAPKPSSFPLGSVESTSSSGTMIAASDPGAAPSDPNASAAVEPPEAASAPVVDRWSPTGERAPIVSMDWRPKPPERTSRRSPLQLAVGAVVVLGVVAVASIKLASRSAPSADRPTRVAENARAAAPPPPVVAPPVPSPAVVAPTASAAAAPSASASAEPAASAAPSSEPSGAAAARAPDPSFDAAATKGALVKATQVRDWAGAETAFKALVENKPGALRDPTIELAMRDLVVGAERDGHANDVLDALAHKLGAEGVDVVYDIVQSRGGSKAAEHAVSLLREPDVIKKASPALRIAFELREAPCEQKAALLDRAVKEGDARALGVMRTLASSCLRHNKALGRAMLDLAVRLEAESPHEVAPPRRAHPKR